MHFKVELYWKYFCFVLKVFNICGCLGAVDFSEFFFGCFVVLLCLVVKRWVSRQVRHNFEWSKDTLAVNDAEGAFFLVRNFCL